MKDNILAIPIIIITGIALLIIAIFIFNTDSPDKVQTVEPLDVTLNFYNEWLSTKKTNVDSLPKLLAITTALDADFAIKLQVENPSFVSVDPVLCMKVTPDKIGAKRIYELADTAEYMVLGRSGVSTQESALVFLTKKSDVWQISRITCSTGETAPVSEFTFEKDGFILKDVPAPLDSNFWHLVFVEDGQPGHTVPLLFDQSSSCTYKDGTVSVCDTSRFAPAQGATLKGDALESGVNVKFMTLK